MKLKPRHFFLLAMVPLSEIKAIFYNSDQEVSWYLFSDTKRYLCNVLEDYSNIIIFGVVFYNLAFLKTDEITKQICLYLFILNALDFIHLGLYDMQGFVQIKIILAVIITLYVIRNGKFKIDN